MKKRKQEQRFDKQSAMNIALRFIAYRPRSVAEVEGKLKDLDYEDAEIKKTVKKLLAMDYLDDARFAELWVVDRIKLRPKGKLVLRRELLAKGIDEKIIEKTLADLSREDELGLAARLIEKKFKTIDLKNKKRAVAFLLRRGFSWDTIKEAMKEIND